MELPAHLEPDNPLWRYALAVWQHVPAQKACLALQNEGWSVTRILSAGWLARHDRLYTGIEDATVTEWRDRVTGCLRATRVSMPKAAAPYSSLRSNVAALELEAEKIELALVWLTLTARNPELSDMHVRDNLIRTNLAAAAPASAPCAGTEQLLATLCDSLTHFQPEDMQP